MKIIRTHELTPATMPPSATERLWVYNGLDCCVTAEVLEALLPQLDSVTAATYDFSRALQGPILEMNMRGVRVDMDRRAETIASYRADVERLSDQLEALIRDGIGYRYEVTKGRRYRWPSDSQLCTLFYDVLAMPPVRKRNDKGLMVPTVNRAALEKIQGYFYAEPIVNHLLVLRDLQKKISFLNTALDPDGRIRTSFNIAGTDTGRLASSLSDMGTGTNLQNIENRLRAVFIPDPGMKFGNIDLEQSDARVVGAVQWNQFGDSRFLDDCESGDLHTRVSMTCWPGLGWTEDMGANKAIASDSKFTRHFSYRDAAKRLGHGTNYEGQPTKMAAETKIPLRTVKEFQAAYLVRYPAFSLWWEWVKTQVRDSGHMTTLLGRRRWFLGHRADAATHRKAIAYEPQSVTADTIDRALLAIWRRNRVQLLLQVHDSILFQYPEELEDEIIPDCLGLVEQHVQLAGGRDFVIPAEAKVGWNWADYDGKDEDSMRKYSGKRPARRSRVLGGSILDRRASSIT